MSKKRLLWARIVALVYVLLIILPSTLLTRENTVLDTIIGWVATILFFVAPFYYYWLYRQEQQKGYLVAAIITGLVLVFGIVALIMTLRGMI